MSFLKKKAGSNKQGQPAQVNKPGAAKAFMGNLTGALKETKFGNPVKSVGMKLFFIIFVSIVACVLAVGFLAYNQTQKLVEENVSEASLQTIKQVANNLDVVMKTYEDLSLQIVIDQDIKDEFQIYTSTKDTFEQLQASRDIQTRLSNYIMSNSTLSSISLIPTKSGQKGITSGNASNQQIEAAPETAWFKETVELGGKTVWIVPQADGLLSGKPYDTIAIARLIKNMNTSDNHFVLIMEMPAYVLSDRYKDVDLGDGSTIYIADTAGRYITSIEDPSLIGQPALVDLNQNGDEGRSGRPKLQTKDGENVLAAYQTFSSAGWKLVGAIPVDKLAEQANVIRNLTFITAGVAVLLAVAIGLLVLVTIARPLVQLRNLMVEGAGGNLTVRATVSGKRKDEIGELAGSFNGMMAQITALAQQTTQSADEVLQTASELTDASKKTAIAAKEIAVATEEIAGGATSLAMEAEKGSDLTGSINEQMKQVIAANQQMAGSASDMEQASGQGTAYMGILIEKTGATEEMTRSMVEKVDALKESTGSIVKILDVLNNLTKQTNILSLNATIEAARAGAAGKGFMVVADEIRKLADQSRQSIDVVAQITEKIQKEIEETVSVLSDAYPLFQEQIVSVKEANTIFMTVQSQMGQFIEKLELATESIGQLDNTQSVLSEAMANVSAVAEQSSATSEEVASLSTEQLGISEGLVQLSDKLDAVSRGLKESLAKFKV